jgi:hypothetical protein
MDFAATVAKKPFETFEYTGQFFHCIGTIPLRQSHAHEAATPARVSGASAPVEAA